MFLTSKASGIQKYLDQLGFSVFCGTEHMSTVMMWSVAGLVKHVTRYFSSRINSVNWITIFLGHFLPAGCFCFGVATE